MFGQRNGISEDPNLDRWIEEFDRGSNTSIHDRKFLASMDVIGINYHVTLYQKRKANPPFNARPMIISEASSDYSTRGIYVTTKESSEEVNISA